MQMGRKGGQEGPRTAGNPESV